MSYLLLDFKTNEEFKTSKDGEVIYFDSEGQPILYLPEFNRIHLFVGQNNSGKSKFLRGLLKHPSYSKTKTAFPYLYTKVSNELQKLSDTIKKNNTKPHFRWAGFPNEYTNLLSQKFPLFSSTGVFETLETAAQIVKQLSQDVTKISQLKPRAIIAFLKFLIQAKNRMAPPHSDISVNIDGFSFYYGVGVTLVISNHSDELQALIDSLENLSNIEISTLSVSQKIFIPTLRSTHSIYRNNIASPQKEYDDIFKTSVFTNYNFDRETQIEKQKINIHTGLNLYNEIKEKRNGSDKDVDAHEAFVEFIRNHFFSNYARLSIIPVINNQDRLQNITVRFGDETGKPIHFLGDGINSLINILYPIFTAPDDAWIFIEEPELHLHPGLQRIFINELISNELLKKKNLTFFITTHSNHILDISSDVKSVSIYTFSKLKENHHKFQVVKSGDVSILSELGVQNSSVYLSNCTIWVEGITDRIYLSKYLECFIKEKQKIGHKVKEFDEDLHYAFFLYGGSNIVHYIFKEETTQLQREQEEEIQKIRAKFLSNRILLIADEDKGKEKRHELFSNQQGDYFLYEKLKVREIENLLSAEFLLANLHLVTKSISKANIANIKFHATKLKSDYLAEYIISCATEAGIAFPKSFKAESGTVNPLTYKKLLAEVAHRNMTWELMTKEAQELAERVYTFIELNNS
jgi:predicted ATP-dependent endonuclease of OLD family